MKRHGMLGFGAGILLGGLLGALLDVSPVDALPKVDLPELSVPDRVRAFASSRHPVLVIDVREPSRTAAVRAAIGGERIVAETAHGFALRERRLVVSSLEEAGAILSAAGWEDAGLQILRFEPVRTSEEQEVAARADAGRLAELMQKPTLTYFEAQQALALL